MLTVNLPLWERKRDLGRTNGLIKRSAPLADTPDKYNRCSQQDNKKHSVENYR